ncbi:MAG TPA: S8 family serine peptidase, partial [Dissulfurispiraceae bacterium]|nr:S8 family serine peptidase [Dissulfurispiraceae bacterium]
QWNEPWYGVLTDLDIFLLDSNGNIAAHSDYDNISSEEPFEFFSYTNGSSTATYQIVIARWSGTGTPRLKYVFMQNGNSCISGVQYNTSNGGDIVGPTVEGHSATSDGFSVAAVPYSDSTTPEYYSSRGPATHYFGPVVGTTPASAITATTLQQPDFAATDGGCTTFFSGYSAGCYRFYGTSAAAPHAAAVTALLKQEANQLSIPLTRMVTKYVLQSTSQTVINGDINSVGSGLISASAAVNQLINLKPVILVAGSTIVGSYTLVSPAYTDSITGDTIEMRATSFAGDLAFNSNKSITLKGGYAAGYATQNGTTTINGKLTISNGSVVIDKVVLN